MNIRQTSKRSSTAFASGIFRPHGQVDIWTEGTIVRLEACGPFNREGVLAMGLAMRDLFAGAPVGPRFADILEMHQSLLASPDALEAFTGFLKTMSEAKTAPVAVAFVAAPEVEGRSLMLPIFARIYAEHGREFAAFETLAEAEAWVRARLGSA
ncbi:hypothetical protein G8A07_02555 [Roseateles sp. DAIF2]|uniref:hypothetical protein n=1 Tax=Roseateles sp. DAIF2 TaxID=2714952 RepID=UPI0018A33761|nr:hypothetical protein [Roseateles sp. DAIF2]QPF71917.1 hypothetical protein G8A07_02555 [Roseateles sp. DAIF2]